MNSTPPRSFLYGETFSVTKHKPQTVKYHHLSAIILSEKVKAARWKTLMTHGSVVSWNMQTKTAVPCIYLKFIRLI